MVLTRFLRRENCSRQCSGGSIRPLAFDKRPDPFEVS
jgi:hypothetical protein